MIYRFNPATHRQVRRIDALLYNSSFDHEQQAHYESQFDRMSESEAIDLIRMLEANQKPIHPGWSTFTRQSDIMRQVLQSVENPKT